MASTEYLPPAPILALTPSMAVATNAARKHSRMNSIDALLALLALRRPEVDHGEDHRGVEGLAPGQDGGRVVGMLPLQGIAVGVEAVDEIAVFLLRQVGRDPSRRGPRSRRPSSSPPASMAFVSELLGQVVFLAFRVSWHHLLLEPAGHEGLP